MRTAQTSGGATRKQWTPGLVWCVTGLVVVLVSSTLGVWGGLRYSRHAAQRLAAHASRQAAPPAPRPEVTVTIPEGFTLVQIAHRLAARHVCPAAEFMRAADHDAFAESYLPQVTARSHVTHRLEGYLFPDTYRFYVGESAHDVLAVMLHNFIGHATGLEAALVGRPNDLAHVVTIASMVEREAKVDTERPIIASVMHNRLRRGMPLQIDATIQYALGRSRSLTVADTALPSPYNTYLHTGLPPGPIANPGMASLRAALHPAQTEYLYYVVRNDKSGRDFFARTYAGHLANIARSQANLRRAGGE